MIFMALASLMQTTGHTLTFDSSNTVDYELASVGEDTLNFDTENNETLSFSFRLHCVLNKLPIC